VSGRRGPPQLLVSVRTPEEARTALAGGADIIDIKDPDRGSLGRALPGVIEAVASLTGQMTPETLLSVALGEVRETLTDPALNLPSPLRLLPNITFAKLGLAQLRDERDWVARWVRARERISSSTCAKLKWIGVIYADAETAQTPPALEVIDAAAATGCAGLLVDTFFKGNGRLLDHASPADLAGWARLARASGLKFAVAGRLSADDLPHLSTVGADIIAVRSAVCHGGDRRGTVCADAIAQFKRAVRGTAADVHVTDATVGVAACRSGG
jgi:uncharacterized protein (UPF0264 family)